MPKLEIYFVVNFSEVLFFAFFSELSGRLSNNFFEEL